MHKSAICHNFNTMKNIYSIGYGSRKIDDFIELLRRYNISTIIDIRTMPASRFQPSFSKKRLSDTLHLEDIEYIFLGKELGGKPADIQLYTNGVIDYDKLAQSTLYVKGINDLICLSNTKTVCIMCAELKPESCHRKHLVFGC